MTFSASMPHRVEWGDCDPADIVFYPNYFRWFDAASWNLFEVAGGGWDGIRRRFGPVYLWGDTVDRGCRAGHSPRAFK